MTRYHTMSIIKVVSVIIFIGGLVGYSLFNSRIFIAGPQIHVIEPQNGSSIEDNPLIQVSGTAENIAYLNLNDKQIYTDENSIFQETLLLNPGYNIIQLKAEDKFGRSVMNTVEVVYAGESTIIKIPVVTATTTATSTATSSDEI